MDVYLDHHATTPCAPEALDAMLPWFTERFGNAASRSHRWGTEARGAVEDARGTLALRVGCAPREVVFTSGATEANNLALLGVLRASRGRGDHLVTSGLEHKAVLDVAEAAAREGFRVTIVPPEADGVVDPDRFVAALEPGTVLASLMWVNNELGTVQPVEAVGEACRARGIPLHTDASQALAWLPIDLRQLPVDLVSFSAHKAYGPKGVGALVVRRRRPAVPIEPLLHGGGHERGLRSGTLPVPLIVGFGAALEAVPPADVPRVAALRDTLFAALREVGGVQLNGSEHRRVAGNLHVSIDGVDVRALMMACPSVAFSSGSACASETLRPSHVLEAIGMSPDRAARSVRFGLGRGTTVEGIDHAARTLVAQIERIRAMGAGDLSPAG